jgi:hypothetical protein
MLRCSLHATAAELAELGRAARGGAQHMAPIAQRGRGPARQPVNCPFRVRPCRLRARARLAESAAVGTEALQMAAASSGSALARAVPACPRDLPARLAAPRSDASRVRGNKGARQMRSCDDSRARSARAQSFRPSRATAAPPRAQASQRLLLSDSCADHRCAKESAPRPASSTANVWRTAAGRQPRLLRLLDVSDEVLAFPLPPVAPRRANQLPRLAAAGWLTRSSATAFTWLAPAWASPRARRPWRCSFWAPCPCWERSSRPCR